jgi:hypothetical protein
VVSAGPPFPQVNGVEDDASSGTFTQVLAYPRGL